MGLFDFVSDVVSEVIVTAVELPKNVIECVIDTCEKIDDKLNDQ